MIFFKTILNIFSQSDQVCVLNMLPQSPPFAAGTPWEEGVRPALRSLGVVERMALPMLLLSFILLLVPSQSLTAQTFTQTINRTAAFTNPDGTGNELRIYNINGSITVEGYAGTEIKITAMEEIEGSSNEIERAKKELKFIVDRKDDLVLIYLNAPFIDLRRHDGRIHYRFNRWEDDDYEFFFDITVKVPRTANIYASTINQGQVYIENTLGVVDASNVNGELDLSGIAGKTKATTVNGDITARYKKSPNSDSEYHTINGTIDVSYPDDLSADIRFKSMHGDLFTDFTNIERLQAKVEQGRRKKRGGVTYRIDKFTPIRIGDGGPVFNFEVLNGDVYIKRIKS